MGKNPLDILKGIAAEEDKFLQMEFVSPVFRNRKVATTIKGLVQTLNIPDTQQGWHKFKPVNFEFAKSVGAADYEEVANYLKRLPIIRLITVYREDDVYYGFAQKNNQIGLNSSTLLPIFLVDDNTLDFEQIVCRFDGGNIWFESVDMKADLSKGEYLRTSYSNLIKPSEIRYSGLTFEEKAAYSLKFEMDKELKKKMEKKNLEEAVSHAGGTLVSYREKSDSYSVTFTVDGEEFTSHISKSAGHSVISAGICLSGKDADFDLKSLVTVIREGQRRSLIHRTRW